MELGDVTVHNLKQLKKLNAVILPVTYSDKVNMTLVCVCVSTDWRSLIVLYRCIRVRELSQIRYDIHIRVHFLMKHIFSFSILQ